MKQLYPIIYIKSKKLHSVVDDYDKATEIVRSKRGVMVVSTPSHLRELSNKQLVALYADIVNKSIEIKGLVNHARVWKYLCP